MKRSPVCVVLIIALAPVFATPQVSWTKHTITSGFGGACSVHAQDINGDGLIDVLAAGWDINTIALWTNNGGQPISWTTQTLDTLFNGVSFVFAADVDGDADVDVLASAWNGSQLGWWENGGGNPIEWTKHIISPAFFNGHEITAADMDGDNDIDVLAAAALEDEIAWFENDGMDPPGWTRHTISDSFDGVRSVKAADMDGDGLLDVVGAALAANAVAWWRNNGDSTWTEHILDSNFGMAHMVYAFDLDSDADMDIVAAAYTANDIAWWRNDGGTPTQFTKQIIDGSLLGALGVYVADINNDGYLDVLGTSDIADDVVWYSNNGAVPVTWSKSGIDGNCNGAWPVYASDLDNDGDMDVLAAAYASDAIYWYENGLVGINENFSPPIKNRLLQSTIIQGPLELPPGISARIYDITGRTVRAANMGPGIYFIEPDGYAPMKVIVVR